LSKSIPEKYRQAKMVTEGTPSLERPDGLALEEMIREAVPTLMKDSDEYNKYRTTLRDILSSSQNLHALTHKFGKISLT
jgi:hypothetical protein